MLSPPKISSNMNQQLEAKVTRKEIKDMLYEMEPDKAPGPDGLTARFIQVCSQIVKKDLHRMVSKSQCCQKIGGNTNSAFLALIPKEKGANTFNRQIVDDIILVQEAIHSSLQRKEKGMVVKLDLANAFDRVRHNFLFEVMHKFGFGQEFIRRVRACISGPWIAPMVNGKATEFFKAFRGLR
eukprot:PITA_22251